MFLWRAVTLKATLGGFSDSLQKLSELLEKKVFYSFFVSRALKKMRRGNISVAWAN